MKIYNKKGFAWGIFWLVLGVSALAADLWINPDDFLPKTIKDVIIDFIILIMGLVWISACVFCEGDARGYY